MGHYDFHKDLTVADATEYQVARILHELGWKFLGKNDTKTHDLEMVLPNGREVTVEVKEDFRCRETGNVALEYTSWGRDSGIRVVTADFWVYKIHTEHSGIEFRMTKHETLKNMVRRHRYFSKRAGGDPGSDTRNYLFFHSVFAENAPKFHHINQGDILHDKHTIDYLLERIGTGCFDFSDWLRGSWYQSN